jgi:hypothetical protein
MNMPQNIMNMPQNIMNMPQNSNLRQHCCVQLNLDSSFSFFMFCCPCISIHACNKTNLKHCFLSSVYSVIKPIHVSGLLVSHHQEVAMYICDNWYVSYVLVDCRRVRWQWAKTYNTYQLLHIYIYKVIQEGSAMLWEMIVCVILSKKVHMNMGPILKSFWHSFSH